MEGFRTGNANNRGRALVGEGAVQREEQGSGGCVRGCPLLPEGKQTKGAHVT